MKKIINVLLIVIAFGCGSEPQLTTISVTLDKEKLLKNYKIFNDDIKKSIEIYKVLEAKYGAKGTTLVNNILDKAKTGDSDSKNDLETVLFMNMSIQANSYILLSSYSAIGDIEESYGTEGVDGKKSFEKFKMDFDIERDKAKKSFKEMPGFW